MKKLLLSVAAFALVATTMTSCKKDYTCECTVSGTGVSGTVSGTINDTKKNAKDKCEADNGTIAGVTTSCKIK
jgi:hypothetical protein